MSGAKKELNTIADLDQDVRNVNELSQAFELARHTVYKRYLPELSSYPIIAPSQAFLDQNAQECVRAFHLKELTCKKGEDLFQKLSTVYHASMSLGCNLIVMLDTPRLNAPVSLYLGVRNSGIDEQQKQLLATSFRTLKNGLMSNFPGTSIEELSSQEELPQLIDDIFGETSKYITSVSCVAARRDKSQTEQKDFVQGIERFIDAMRGTAYTALFIAEPIAPAELSEIRRGYEELYSTLTAFQKTVWSYNENQSHSVMETLTTGVSKSVSNSTNHTRSHTNNVGISLGINGSKFNSQGTSTPTNVSRAGAGISSASSVLGHIAMLVSAVNPVIGAIVGGVAGVASVAGSAMQGSSVTESVGRSLGLSGGINAGHTVGSADGVGHAEVEGTHEDNASGTTDTVGTGKTMQIELVNKTVDEMLKRIEEQLTRTREGEDYGAYSCGAYFLSGKYESSLLAANTYRALMLGEGSSVESGAINLWNGSRDADQEKVLTIKKYLKRFTHPIMGLPLLDDHNQISQMIQYTPGTTVSGLELPLHLGLPLHSVFGLPVIDHAEFGRNVTVNRNRAKENLISIGSIYHMGQMERKATVELDKNSLASHVFITGSTGAGKTNTVTGILKKIVLDDKNSDVHFLVIEPAKGEYRHVLGGYECVSVYGTNPNYTKLLHINPFVFPDNVTVCEHIDRLVEIFNVCWPMYAAMPAILKDAVVESYEEAGWDIELSENRYGTKIFPGFQDVMDHVENILNSSAYSNDAKGDYVGALVARLKSLTNGINRQIFTADALSDESLFDQNVIIDMSRVGSTETKSLIMGLLVMKLQEYRLSSSEPDSKGLKHITVLEEAHNLLRRTSLEQSSESANLLGKSVEMLTNSIAELRAFGEGFIIADQAPGLLDMAVVRNTNTKIVHRLPDQLDRELVGRAMGMNDEQIRELSKLELGVAAVYQNDWIEPVLCKVEEFPESSKKATDVKDDNSTISREELKQQLINHIINRELQGGDGRPDLKTLAELIYHSQMSLRIKCDLMEYLQADDKHQYQGMSRLLYDLLDGEHAVEKVKGLKDIQDIADKLPAYLGINKETYPADSIRLVTEMVICELQKRNSDYGDFFRNFVEYVEQQKGVL